MISWVSLLWAKMIQEDIFEKDIEPYYAII